jgi:hypothetical protein
MKHRVPFSTYVDPKSSDAHRLYDLLARYGLQDRIIDSEESAHNVVPAISSEQFDNTHALIATHVAASMSFLRKSLQ